MNIYKPVESTDVVPIVPCNPESADAQDSHNLQIASCHATVEQMRLWNQTLAYDQHGRAYTQTRGRD